MAYNSSQPTYQTGPFHEILEQRPGGYAFYRGSDQAPQVMTTEDNVLGAVGVILVQESNKLAMETILHPGDDGVIDNALMTASSDIVSDMPKLTDGAQEFMMRAFNAVGNQHYNEGHRLIGGLALIASKDGFSTELFMSRKLLLSMNFAADSMNAAYTQMLKNYQPAPDYLKVIAKDLPQSNRDKKTEVVRSVVSTIIKQGIKSPIQTSSEPKIVIA